MFDCRAVEAILLFRVMMGGPPRIRMMRGRGYCNIATVCLESVSFDDMSFSGLELRPWELENCWIVAPNWGSGGPGETLD